MPSNIEGVLRGPLGGRVARQRDNREVETHRQQVMLRNLEALDRSLNIREKVESAPLKRKKRKLEILSVDYATENFDETMKQKAEADKLELDQARLETTESKKEYLAEAIPEVTAENHKEMLASWRDLGINIDALEGLTWDKLKPTLNQMRDSAIRDLPFERQMKLKQEALSLQKELATFKHSLRMKQLDKAASLKGGVAEKQVKIDDLSNVDVTIAMDRLEGELGTDHSFFKDVTKVRRVSIALASAAKYKKDTTGISQEDAYKSSIDDMYSMGVFSGEEESEEGFWSSIKGWFTGLSSIEPATPDFNQEETEKALQETEGGSVEKRSNSTPPIIINEADLR